MSRMSRSYVARQPGVVARAGLSDELIDDVERAARIAGVDQPHFFPGGRIVVQRMDQEGGQRDAEARTAYDPGCPVRGEALVVPGGAGSSVTRYGLSRSCSSSLQVGTFFNEVKGTSGSNLNAVGVIIPVGFRCVTIAPA